MAIFHASVKVFSRSKGHSATAAAAYRLGARIEDERTGVAHDYTRRRGVAVAATFAPPDVPVWASDPAQLWNHAEAAETRRNACVAREFEVALPIELTPDQNAALLSALACRIVARYGVAANAAGHDFTDVELVADDGRRIRKPAQPHGHILTSTRRLTAAGFGEKVRELDGRKTGPNEVEWFRAMAADEINRALIAASIVTRVDHRSLKNQHADALARGDLEMAVLTDRLPSLHVGKRADAVARERRNQMIEGENAQRREQYRAKESFGCEAWEKRIARRATQKGQPARISDLNNPAGTGMLSPVGVYTADVELTEAERIELEALRRCANDRPMSILSLVSLAAKLDARAARPTALRRPARRIKPRT